MYTPLSSDAPNENGDHFRSDASIAPISGGSIIFHVTAITDETPPVLELRANGDILVKGTVIDNNKRVVDGLREFLDAMCVRQEPACAHHTDKPTALVHRSAYNQIVEELAAARREIEELQAKIKASPADEHDDWGHIDNST